MTVSSNFGNIFSLLFASIFLPLLPMAPIHLIVLNLVYDLSCIALPFDRVDKDFLKKPRIWEAKSITRFMAWFGPISSVFDILTFIALYFIIVPMITGYGYVQQTVRDSSSCSFKPAGLSSPCGPKLWSSICSALQNCLLFKVGQPLQSWQRPYWAPSL